MRMSLRRILIISVLITSCHGNDTALLDKLFGSSMSNVLPFCGNKTVVVQYGIAIRQLIDVDEPQQTIQMNIWVRMKWHDCNLVWNPDDYGGKESIIVPASKLWIPDITLFDNADFMLQGMYDYRPKIRYDGVVTYNFPTVIASMCNIVVTAFPFDSQQCPLTFASWAYHGLQLDITNLSVAGDVGDLRKNSEWDIVEVPVKRKVEYFGCCPEPYPTLTFFLNLRRKPLYYVLNTLFPILLTSQIAMLGFILPVESGEKIGLQLTVLLSIAVFMMVVSDTLPPTSENFPLLGIYFVIAMTLVACSTVMTVIVVNIFFRGQFGHRMPGWVRKVFLECLGRVVCVTDPEPDQSDELIPPPSTAMNSGQVGFKDKKIPDYGNDLSSQGLSSPALRLMQEHLLMMKKAEKDEMEKQKVEDMENEWKKLSVVLDRLFLLIFFIVSVAATIGILVESTLRA